MNFSIFNFAFFRNKPSRFVIVVFSEQFGKHKILPIIAVLFLNTTSHILFLKRSVFSNLIFETFLSAFLENEYTKVFNICKVGIPKFFQILKIFL